jgi:hypothetical protein
MKTKTCLDCGCEFECVKNSRKRCDSCAAARNLAQRKQFYNENSDRINANARAKRAANKPSEPIVKNYGVGTCKHCGEQFQKTACVHLYCSTCKPLIVHLHRAKYVKQRTEERKHRTTGEAYERHDLRCAWIVVRDPDEEGGFRSGAKFSVEEKESMLKMAIFTPGTVLASRDKKYQVWQTGYTQRLYEVNQ